MKTIKALLAAWYAGYSPIGKFWLSLGLAALIVDASISYQYGVSQTTLHGLGFALVAIFFALLPDAAYSEFEHRRFGSGVAMGVLCVPLGLVAFYSHLGYGAGVRVGDIQQTGFHNAKVEGSQDNATKLNEKIAFLEKRRETLDGEMAALVSTKVNGWAVNVRPSSAAELDGAIAAKELEASNEGKRKGCKKECEKRTNELAHLKALRAKALEIEKNDEQHTATMNGLASARNEVAASTFKSSNVVNQTNVAAQVWKAMTGAKPEDAIKPDTVTTVFANLFIATGGSLAFMIMAPVGFFLAGRFRRDSQFASWQDAAKTSAKTPEKPASPGLAKHTTNVIMDSRLASALAAHGHKLGYA